MQFETAANSLAAPSKEAMEQAASIVIIQSDIFSGTKNLSNA
jgi:hypothetical protein